MLAHTKHAYRRPRLRAQLVHCGTSSSPRLIHARPDITSVLTHFCKPRKLSAPLRRLYSTRCSHAVYRSPLLLAPIEEKHTSLLPSLPLNPNYSRSANFGTQFKEIWGRSVRPTVAIRNVNATVSALRDPRCCCCIKLADRNTRLQRKRQKALSLESFAGAVGFDTLT